ncbi:hypothetical protein [Neptuniibacter sp.]|uniref:hypothetical protein n=1 Tax=Neptuniibacter sp. TaxID=1962643 RepID=UPI0026169E7A|nr:hypothetical protein [Neptuniibacter sp.]MCP4597048.1 hypothetical protein [Neptuniibacter sp.]
MRIERATDMAEIQRCVPFEQKIRDKGRDDTKISDMLYSIKFLISNPQFGFWIAYDDRGEVIGYFSALITIFPGAKRLNLLRIYAKQREVFEAFEKVGGEFAKEWGVKIIAMIAKGHIKAFRRRHGFKVVSVNMEKEL